jgi:outer membrane protein, heavy metal efflux system
VFIVSSFPLRTAARKAKRPLGWLALAAVTAQMGVTTAASAEPRSVRENVSDAAANPAPMGAERRASSPRNAGEIADLERSLAEKVTVRAVLGVALARHPELAEARERARAARETADSVARLPDPELEYQLWAAPLARPYALAQAEMHMVGLKQAFPAPGSLGARSDAAAAEAVVALQMRRTREQELVARVRRAHAAYYLADREYRIRLDHLRLAEQALAIARASHQGGGGSQQDVLRAAVETSRVRTDLATVEGDRRIARALLNTLMARAVDAPLGPPESIEPSALGMRADQAQRLVAGRPEIVAARSAVRARVHELEAARAAGRWPSFMVGVQYMYAPPMDDPHHYGVMVSMSLPWLNARYAEEARAAEARVAAERSALSSSELAARYELRSALERLQAARESLAILERDLMPQARQSFESAQAVYRGGQADSLALFDALRSLLDVRVERERALARLENAVADVERSAGTPLSQPASAGGKP